MLHGSLFIDVRLRLLLRPHAQDEDRAQTQDDRQPFHFISPRKGTESLQSQLQLEALGHSCEVVALNPGKLHHNSWLRGSKFVFPALRRAAYCTRPERARIRLREHSCLTTWPSATRSWKSLLPMRLVALFASLNLLSSSDAAAELEINSSCPTPVSPAALLHSSSTVVTILKTEVSAAAFSLMARKSLNRPWKTATSLLLALTVRTRLFFAPLLLLPLSIISFRG